jgi:hypothetical protein
MVQALPREQEMTVRACLMGVVLTFLFTGCGGSPRTVPVSGRVTLNGQPLANATVMFVPVTDETVKNPPPSSVGLTDSDGRYSLMLNTDSKVKGAVVGKHKVMITLGAPQQGGSSADTKRTFQKQLPQRYNRKTELACEVPTNGRDDANFPLTTP